MKRKQHIHSQINDDLRWQDYDQLVKEGNKLKADKLKEVILDSYKYKKPCHHVSEGK
jgi:hypothetical protein